METVWSFVRDNWKFVLSATAFVGIFGRFLMWFPKRRQAKAEAGLAELSHDKTKRDLFDKGIGQKICIYADAVKKRRGTNTITFSDEELLEILTDDQKLRLHAAMEMLRKEGRASKADDPGYWHID
jgi:hypothetical protein